MTCEHIGHKVYFYREQLKWSQNQLAKESGVSQSFISAIEKGEKIPTIIILSKICDALQITLSEFFSDACPLDHSSVMLIRLTNTLKKLSPEQIEALDNFLKTLKE